MDEASKVQVAVRLRPMNKRELDMCTKCIVDMDNNQTVLYHPDAPFGEPPKKGSHVKHQPKSFAFDNCFWSMDESNTKKFQGQDKVFDNVGRSLLKNAFGGYNACMFAYGQTGSGKSYTMMGTNDQKGIIPQLCDALFEKIEEDKSSEEQSHTVEVSYMEIYNEKVHDLLAPNSKGNLKVREHKILGPYVDGLSQLAVKAYKDIENLMVEGNKSRTVAATNMNSESSRSHAVFTIKLTQTLHDKASGVSGERVSKMSLVDLAGSERVSKTGAIGERMKEGSNINKSLTTLGLVIKALAESSSASSKSKRGFVPYRDSVLTWLLKDNLGGNSKTVMIATVSPAADNYEETLSTLRYADSAKRIVNHAVVNEDPNAKIIRELRTEVDTLKQQLVAAESMKAPDLQEKLQESEKLIEEMSKTWEEKLQETERIHKERHAALESMGVSVETSGIKVDSERAYLVNLNADPSLNELLVYYLKDVTHVGSGDSTTQHDIQLKGLGISSHHCTINIENDREIYVTPIDGARTCVNGSPIDNKTRVRHGDRVLWGNNHFFRLNIPRRDSSMMTSSTELAEELHVDYDFAQQEIMQQAHDPIQESIEAIEKQYENDKQAALEAQKQMYEEQMIMLRSQISSGTGNSPVPWNHYLAGSHTSNNVNDRLQRRIQQMAQERNSKFKQGLSKLKEELMRVNMYAREANELAQELRVDAQYSVTLQIPSSNLSPNRRRGALMSEPAILARNSDNKTEVFSMEDFESRLVSMREMYQEHKNEGPLADVSKDTENPFQITAANHDLIGVANVFLDALFYDVKLDYYVAIINQQGEVSGRLHVELCKIDGSLNDSYNDPDVSSLSSDDSASASSSRDITLRVSIKDAKGLPPALSNFVFCQYTFWGESEAISVAPVVDESFTESDNGDPAGGKAGCKFNHEKEFTVSITEEFVEHLYDGALSIEVYGHPSDEGRALIGRSLADRWSEVTRKLELAVEIQELNDAGLYEPVEVQVKPDVYCGGVFQLRQGYSRRIVVRARPIATSGSLPLTVDSITGVSVGGLCIRSHTHKGLDSYQEDGLTLLRSRWNEALEKRKQYLDDKMQLLAAKQDKTESDVDREKNLMSQWLALADERNNVLVPQPGSGVPGAPASGDPEFGMEHHCPVIYLDLNIEDMTPRHADDDTPIAELAILDKEMNTTFLPLPVVHTDNNVASCIVTSWDSSIHDSIHLNRLTPHNERIYMIVKAFIKLSHPAPLDVTLRKRICVNVYKHQSLTMKLRKKINRTASAMGATHNAVGRLLNTQDNLKSCGILYDMVSSIPKASEELEDRETMAKLAASGYDHQDSADGESYIEKYIKSVAAVESIITLDRLGQEVAIKDSLLASGRTPKRTFSSPNINAMMKTSTSTPSFSDKMRSPLVRLSESFQDLSRHVLKPSASTNSPLANSSSPQNNTNSLDDSSIADNSTKPKLAGGEPISDSGTAADEGYGSTPRRSANSKQPSAAATGSSGTGVSDDTVMDTEPGEDSRKTLNFDHIPTSEESIKLEESCDQHPDPSQQVIQDTFQNSNSNITSQSNDQNLASDEISQPEVSSTQINQSDEIDPDATPTRQNTSQSNNEQSGQLNKVVAPIASIDSDTGTPDVTPKHTQADELSGHIAEDEDILNVTNELLIVEDGDLPTQNFKEAPADKMVESGVVLTADRVDDIDDDLSSYNEDTEEDMSGSKKTRADMLSDIYSMNALDELEALGDSMESLNSCCSTDDTDELSPPVKSPTAATNVMVSTPRSNKTTAAPLLLSSESEADSGDEAVSMCSFGSTADLSAVSSTPLPPWVEIGVPVLVLSTKGDSPEKGYIRYVGETEFAQGTWVGVQLDNMKGKNNGTVQGTSYFSCKPKHGVFVRHDRLYLDKKRTNKTFPATKVVLNKPPTTPPASKPTAASTPSYLKPTRASRVRKN